jgi:hypothetical protein
VVIAGDEPRRQAKPAMAGSLDAFGAKARAPRRIGQVASMNRVCHGSSAAIGIPGAFRISTGVTTLKASCHLAHGSAPAGQP